MIITYDWMKDKTCCSNEEAQLADGHTLEEVVDYLKKESRYKNIFWLISKVLTRKKTLEWGIHNAELVLPIFEDNYPDDDRPRRAIEASKKVLANDTEENRKAASIAAKSAYAAYAAYAADDVVAAAYATYAAYAAAAYAAAAYAAYAADDAAAAYAAAAAAAYADDGDKCVKDKIIEYGFNLVTG